MTKSTMKTTTNSSDIKSSGFVAIEASATVDFNPESIEANANESSSQPLPRFTMVANTGAVPMRLKGWKHPVIVDFSGLVIPSQKRPVRVDHDPQRGVGHTDSISLQDGQLVASGVISRDTPDAKEVTSSSKNGFPWQASIGGDPEKVQFIAANQSVTVNGHTFQGPIYVARKTRLNEISFVDIGGDSHTSAAIAASHSFGSEKGSTMTKFEQWLEAKGFDDLAALSDSQKSSLEAMFKVDQSIEKTNRGKDSDPNYKDNVRAEGLKSLDDEFAEIQARQQNQEAIKAMAKQFSLERPAIMEDIRSLAQAAIDANEPSDRFELAARRLIGTVMVPGTIIRAGRSKAKADTRVIEAAVCLAGGLRDYEKRFDDNILEAAHDHFPQGIGLRELLQISARENGNSGHISPRDVRGLLQAAFAPANGLQASGFSTFSLPGIMSNIANKFLVAGFDAVESAWRQISAIRSVQDFKAISSYSLTGGMEYEKVGPTGEIKHGTVGELEYTNRAETYGRMFAITRTDIINDDLGALTQIPQKLGRGAALKLNHVFWSTFLDNSTFFTDPRGNFFDGNTPGTDDSRLNIEGLTNGVTLFAAQTDPDGYPLAITPRILLVPTGLSVAAWQLMNSTELRNTTANMVSGTANPFAGRFRVVESNYLANSNFTGNSATAWYLLADPSDMPVIEVAFLNGRETPIVETADADFNTLGVQMRGYHDFGVALQEFRGGVKSKGAA